MEEKKRIWDNFEEVCEVQKSEGQKYVIAATTRAGYRYLNIREFYKRKRDGVWKPSMDGIVIPLIVPINGGETVLHPLDGFVEALVKAGGVAATMELMDESKAVFAPKKGK